MESFGVVVGSGAAALLLGYAYFRRNKVTRPPIGLMNGVDVIVIVATIVLIPFIYLALPLWAVTLIVVPSGLGIVYVTLEPVLGNRKLIWLSSLLLVGADVVLATRYGADSRLFLAVNNVLVVLVVIGVSNLWVQGGMKARHITTLAAVLTVYDLVATSVLTLMTDLVGRVSEIPMAPFVAWNGPGRDLALGIGDLLIATTFALAMRKAYGRGAGAVAVGVSLGGIVLALGLIAVGVIGRIIPVMVILGPLMVAQYLTWHRRYGLERTTLEYQTAEPVAARSSRGSADGGPRDGGRESTAKEVIAHA